MRSRTPGEHLHPRWPSASGACSTLGDTFGNRVVYARVQLARARALPGRYTRRIHVSHGSPRHRFCRAATRCGSARWDGAARGGSCSKGCAPPSRRQHAGVPTRHEPHCADASTARSRPTTARLHSAARATRGRAAARRHADPSTRHESLPDATVGTAPRQACSPARLAGHTAAELMRHERAHRAPGIADALRFRSLRAQTRLGSRIALVSASRYC
jgi:hypothetical protein